MQDSSASKEAICSAISSLPCQLSAEDIDDFFSLAQYYATRTPQSFRKVGAWHISGCGCFNTTIDLIEAGLSLLFGSGRGTLGCGCGNMNVHQD